MYPSFIYFDLGNVLLSFNQEQMCRQMAEVASVDLSVVRAAVFDGPEADQLLRDFETGQVDGGAFYEHFCQRTDTRPDRKSLEQAVASIFTPIESMFQLVEALVARRQRIGLLSNTNQIHWDYISSGQYSLLASPAGPGSPFEVAIASHEVGVMKPDIRIYHIAIELAGVPADEIVFVDDRIENVTAARQAGIDAVQFTSTDRFIVDLNGRGCHSSK